MLAEQGVKQEKRGQWFGFILGALSMGAGTFLTYSGHDAVGGTIFATTVIGLASVFLTGQKIKTKQ